MEILDDYLAFFEARITGRYVTSETILPVLKSYELIVDISEIGTSVDGREIHLLTLGTGKKKILAWSQMHGNESTTTKAVFDFLKFLTQKEYYQDEIAAVLAKHTFHIIPILNPDGASAYTRENARGVDLNRDAQQQTEPESRILARMFDEIKPELCLNLHDQRTIYGFDSGLPATVSFLAPAANEQRSLTEARQVAIDLIDKMNAFLQQCIPGQIGRYDDSFNANCVGDAFQMANVPTILFEAGHFMNDYPREKVRRFITIALLGLFDCIPQTVAPSMEYSDIPENKKNFYDLIIRDVRLKSSKKLISVALQYREVLMGDAISFVPYVEAMGDLTSHFGHKEVSANGSRILVNSQEKYDIGEKVSKIISKKDKTVLYIN